MIKKTKVKDSPALAVEKQPVAPEPEAKPEVDARAELLRQSDELRDRNPRAANALRDKAHKMEG